ncbi:MAG TPA: antibiotic biosynthesis monooxygenase family protein [Ktedonosporobacter sp.]|nr:antibiotic biosynthesis monooxygenase family protein [Ktedonosporobacter sp.]
MTQIIQGLEIVTLINVFTVAPQDQQKLVDVLIETYDTVMNTQPGFLSANIHKSLDGTHVVNYVQWRSQEDVEAMQRRPEVIPHIEAAQRLAHIEPHLYEVAFIGEAPQGNHEEGNV